MRKLVSFALALVLCAGLALPALAAEELPLDLEADMVADRDTDPSADLEAESEILPEGVSEEDPTPEAVPEVSPEIPPAEGEELPAASFEDVPEEHSFYAAIMDCADKGITAGYADGTFRPTNQVTRAQFCVMLARAFYPDLVERYSTDFYKEQGWFVPYSQALYNAYVLPGTSFPKTYNDPSVMDRPISRYDMAQLMANIMLRKGFKATTAQKTEAQKKIADYKSIPTQYQDAVKTVFALGIITGYANGTFGGSNVMNRGQGCVVIYRMMNYVPAAKPSDPEASKPTVDDSGKPTVPETPKPETPVTPTQPETPKTGMLTNGKPVTEANVLAMLKELEAKYPDGTDFSAGYSGGYTSYEVKSVVGKIGACSITGGCGAWMALASDYIFGQAGAPARKIDPKDARPGDLLIITRPNGTIHHCALITSKAYFDPDCNAWVTSRCDATTKSVDYTVNWLDWQTVPLVYADGYLSDTMHVFTRYPA